MVEQLSRRQAESSGCGLTSVALTGGVFQNRTLFEQVEARLQQRGFEVLSHRGTPMNDAGLALGQALTAAAREQPPRGN